jgi:class 3 adenylate cyclase
VLATFEAAVAVRCSMAIRDAAATQRLAVCLGVHVGEVELARDDVRGMAVDEAAWVMATAGRDENLVTEVVRPLCKGTDLVSEDAGEHDLKGVLDRWHLYRVQGAHA